MPPTVYPHIRHPRPAVSQISLSPKPFSPVTTAEEARRWFAYPYWRAFRPVSAGYRLPESFVMRSRVRAALLGSPDETSRQLALRALELAPESADAQFLRTYLDVLMQAAAPAKTRALQDARQAYLRFLEAYRYGDLAQALELFNALSLGMQERFILLVHIGSRLLQAGLLDNAHGLLRRALETLELQHMQFFGMRGTVKRDLYRFIVTCLAEIRFKSGDYRAAFGFLQWLGQGDVLAGQDPLECRWDDLLERRCQSPDPLVPQVEKLPWYEGSAEQVDFHAALWAWGKDWTSGEPAMSRFLEKHPQSPWAETVHDFRNWLRTVPRP